MLYSWLRNAISLLQKVKGDISEFPGPKAWPVSAALIDFFILNTFLQAAREIVF